MKIEGSRFLVTGGAGFIGANLVETLLKSGAEQVVIYDNFLRGTLKNVEEAIIDLSAAKGHSQPIIVHSKNSTKNKSEKTSVA